VKRIGLAPHAVQRDQAHEARLYRLALRHIQRDAFVLCELPVLHAEAHLRVVERARVRPRDNRKVCLLARGVHIDSGDILVGLEFVERRFGHRVLF